ncbi:MAG: aspartate/glutamate racemase family protein [Alphaproteobacteria bacterium]|nr:aspartate/glutamate racemase family protein [Alphaproteobacteria bacterium]MBV9694632.1 aspartate/glutamate racemase family protein [Alphaproteobacteria bacterium]
MKTIGMLGGMSWESSAVYYRLVNRAVQQRLGGVRSAKLLIHSFDFGEVETLQDAGRWDAASTLLEDAGRGLASAGADFLMICCNTMHLMSEAVERAAERPLLHIADPLGRAIRTQGLNRVGLVGSRYTMEKGGIVIARLKDRFDVDVVVPDAEDRAELHRIIIEELCRGRFLDGARQTHRAIFERLKARGAQGIVLGCTEIPLLIQPEDCDLPTFDTTALHALAAVDMALEA